MSKGRRVDHPLNTSHALTKLDNAFNTLNRNQATWTQNISSNLLPVSQEIKPQQILPTKAE